MDARWAKFRPGDGRIGVLATTDGAIFVPHQDKDHMNAVAFYIALYRDTLRFGDIAEVDHGYTMGRGTFNDLLVLVEEKIGSPPEPTYSGPITLREILRL